MKIDVLPGKKTYLLLITFVAYTLAQWYAGDIDTSQLIDLLFGSGLVATIKAGLQRQ